VCGNFPNTVTSSLNQLEAGDYPVKLDNDLCDGFTNNRHHIPKTTTVIPGLEQTISKLS
jgi:hypothetical protein